MEKLDFIILGGGAAGLAAGIYAQRFGMKTMVFASEFGGLIATTHLVENYPGFPSIGGFELGQNLKKHAESLGVELKMTTIVDLQKSEEDGKPIYKIVTRKGEEFSAPAVLIALGGEHRHLGAPGEKEFFGKGVSYCATCDGPFFSGKDVAVIGGSDSALKQALYLSEIVGSVKIIYRKEALRAEPVNIEKLKNKTNIEVIYNANVVEFLGEEKLTSVKLDNGNEVKLDGVFIEIGYVPRAELAGKIGVTLNEKGEIVTDKHGKTNLPGIFAAGDVTDEPFKQAITAAAGGSYAANAAHLYLQNLK